MREAQRSASDLRALAWTLYAAGLLTVADAGSGRALATHALVATVLLWLGRVGWRVSHRHAGARGVHAPAPVIREPASPSAS